MGKTITRLELVKEKTHTSFTKLPNSNLKPMEKDTSYKSHKNINNNLNLNLDHEQ